MRLKLEAVLLDFHEKGLQFGHDELEQEIKRVLAQELYLDVESLKVEVLA